MAGARVWMIGIMLSNNPLLPAFMGDFSIATMSTEAVDSLEAKVSSRLVQPKHGPHQRPGIISNLFASKPDQFPALLDHKHRRAAGEVYEFLPAVVV
jgi:hypothetical protein